MKKKFLFTLCIVMLSISLHAQAALFAILFGDKVASEKFNISLELGGTFPNYSNISNTDRSNLGVNFGIGGNLKLSENWFLSPNAYFLAKRNLQLKAFSLDTSNPELNAQFVDVPTEVTLSYIDIPIFIHYQTNNKKYRFGIAPQISFLQKSRGVFSNSSGDFTQNFDGYTRDIDYGMMASFGYILGKAHKGKGVHLYLRYYHGFTDILNDAVSTQNNRSNYFSLQLSLPFITDELAEKNLRDE